TVYRLFRDEFSSWYLEMVKPEYQKPVDRATYEATVGFFDSLLRLLHPYMPFITEELWQHLGERREGESIMYASMPVPGKIDTELLAAVETAKEIVNGVRGVRAQRNIPQREALRLVAVGSEVVLPEIVVKLAQLSEVATAAEKDPAAASFLVGTAEFNIPLLDTIDVEAEKAKINKEIDYLEGFKKSVEKKLGNERFVANAPAAVVEGERKKLADAESKLSSLRATLEALG
ncbi:MAG: class I tRNA ligase family protein, partial [Duncaniella sp.]|nr:class I tRNA ligase family protein [Duncaniella sp.]